MKKIAIPKHPTISKKRKIGLSKELYNLDSRKMNTVLENGSIDLVVTSPPYPMVSMWDNVFIKLDPSIPSVDKWNIDNVDEIFEKMHKILDDVWKNIYQLCKNGSIIAINIGDATRSFDSFFQLFSNSSRIIESMKNIGFTLLPSIYWKKVTNRDCLFFGNRNCHVNSYITMDCEHILLFRKGSIRRFSENEKKKLKILTKEQKVEWYTQIWSIKGENQKGSTERRTGAFPEEIPNRLIEMFSIPGDTVLDPFLGTGTTCNSAYKLGRNSVGFEIEKEFFDISNNQ